MKLDYVVFHLNDMQMSLWYGIDMVAMMLNSSTQAVHAKEKVFKNLNAGRPCHIEMLRKSSMQPSILSVHGVDPHSFEDLLGKVEVAVEQQRVVHGEAVAR